jgi:hypothetical protein
MDAANAVIYAAKSKENGGGSISDQLAQCRAMAETRKPSMLPRRRASDRLAIDLTIRRCGRSRAERRLERSGLIWGESLPDDSLLALP